ncbi:hypothetical protein E2C01_044461 [Portunus trituberculatus]|uniref:Uncharacterized protein n=1 Tax=Portunus trituberculatus TaxID=210409 RepID=A0A5B7FVP6_PORTR|nr:hypothetical protein [Portunus trituberculatus]
MATPTSASESSSGERIINVTGKFYLTSEVEHLRSLYPFTEISILGDLTAHHQLWLSSPFTGNPGQPPFILHDPE